MPKTNLQQAITQIVHNMATQIVETMREATVEDLRKILESGSLPKPARRGRPPKNLSAPVMTATALRSSPTPSPTRTRRHSATGTAVPQLSIREQEVFDAVIHQKRTTEIARELNLSPKTVSTYKRRIYEKLNLENDGQLILYASRKGLI